MLETANRRYGIASHAHIFEAFMKQFAQISIFPFRCFVCFTFSFEIFFGLFPLLYCTRLAMFARYTRDREKKGTLNPYDDFSYKIVPLMWLFGTDDSRLHFSHRRKTFHIRDVYFCLLLQCLFFFFIQLQVCFQPFFSVRLYSLVPFFFLSFRSLHFC